MAYSTRADVILAAGGVDRLLQIADFDGDGREDAGLVTDAISEADGTINTYVRKRYQCPLAAPVPEQIRRLSASLAVFVLRQRRDALTEADMTLHEARILWLRDLAVGKVDCGVNPTPSASPYDAAEATDRPDTKEISRSRFEGFA